ncbi:sulfatase [Photobacterium sp. ZSDE20]|uniref:Sulfatase n=1 Tax=Photobacterium pectinilyticum TaxID=2906793 RepID=A0ABT1N574_9GAMM|nr:sulfatase [Photobacterium sp. ZSDE20]MCQ1059884.1 sulfatase [Photobacterium sp. ZSDE20]MDD1826073.1 sulfatase [Photobacterium sp. ZSDE20]
MMKNQQRIKRPNKFNNISVKCAVQTVFCLAAGLYSQQDVYAGVSIDSTQTQSPNVVIFLIDDLRVDVGSYGNQYIKTPNIDKLASEGVQFNKAYAQQAICGPSRVSMLSGLRPETTGLYTIDKSGMLRPNQPNVVSMPQLFKENGYKTISIGKVYHTSSDDQENWTTHIEKLKNFYAIPGNEEAKYAYEAGDVDDDFYKDGKVANDAVNILEQVKDDKFLMVVGFSKPHLPFNAPKKYWDLYSHDQFEVPSRATPDNMPELALTNWNELRSYGGIPKEGYVDDEGTKTLIHAYSATVSYMDAQLGRVMNALEDLDLRKNTMVVFVSDQGYKLGEYGAWNKHSNMELDTRVPLIISREKNYEKRQDGVISNALVENLDIFPTIVEATNLPMPVLDGQSLLPLLESPDMEWADAAYSVFAKEAKAKMGVSVTDGTWRYSEWRISETQEVLSKELYLHDKSDIAVENVAGQAKYSDIEARLQKMLYRQYPLDAPSFNDRPVLENNAAQ